jgi:hypothetical protein
MNSAFSSISPTSRGALWGVAATGAFLCFFLSTPLVNCALIRLHPTTIPCMASWPGDTGPTGTRNPHLPAWFQWYATPYVTLANLDTPLRRPMFAYANWCWERCIGPLRIVNR